MELQLLLNKRVGRYRVVPRSSGFGYDVQDENQKPVRELCDTFAEARVFALKLAIEDVIDQASEEIDAMAMWDHIDWELSSYIEMREDIKKSA